MTGSSTHGPGAACGPPRKVLYTMAMSPPRAALVAALCTLIAHVAIASAERRPVAVIDLSGVPAGEQLARELGNALNNHERLKPVDDVQLPVLLIGELVDEAAEPLARARTLLDDADQRLQRREFGDAAASAEAGQRALGDATPNRAVIAAYARLTFVLAQARLGQGQPDVAAATFRLVRQLDPEFAPDARRTFPEVIAAFEAANQAAPDPGKLKVTGHGRVVIDGRDAGAAGGTFDVIAGRHVVWLIGPERDPRAKQVAVVAGKPAELAVDDAPTGKVGLVRRARLALKVAPDPAARAAAMHRLAHLLEVRDAVLLTAVNGKLIVQTWRDRAPGFSALREHKGEAPEAVLEPLAPRPRRVVRRPDPPPIRIPVIEKRWYEKPRTWGIGGAVMTALVVGAIWAYASWERSVPLGDDPHFARGAPPR